MTTPPFGTWKQMAENAMSRISIQWDNRFGNETASPQPMAKGDAKYHAAEAGTVERCGNCMHYTYGVKSEDGTCEIVAGNIASDAICRNWHRMQHHDSSIVDERTGNEAGRY